MAIEKDTYFKARAALVALEGDCMGFPGFFLSKKQRTNIRETRENAEHLFHGKHIRRALHALEKERVMLIDVLLVLARKKSETFARRKNWVLMSGIPDREMTLFIETLKDLDATIKAEPFDYQRASALVTTLHRIKRMGAHARREFPLSIRAWRLAKWQAWHRSGSRSWVPYLGTRSGIVT